MRSNLIEDEVTHDLGLFCHVRVLFDHPSERRASVEHPDNSWFGIPNSTEDY